MFATAAAHGIVTWSSYDPGSGLDAEVATDDGRAQAGRELLTIAAGAALGLDVARRLHLFGLLRAGDDETVPVSATEAFEAIDLAAAEAHRIECAVPDLRALDPSETGPTAEGAGFMPRFVRLAR